MAVKHFLEGLSDACNGDENDVPCVRLVADKPASESFLKNSVITACECQEKASGHEQGWKAGEGWSYMLAKSMLSSLANLALC